MNPTYLGDTLVTIYEDVYSEQPSHVPILKILDRIRNSKYIPLIEKIRATEGGERRNALKTKLPAICFSGIINKGKRLDSRVDIHSGFAILDFDHLGDRWQEKWNYLIKIPFVVCAFRSPSGDGIKAVVRIFDGTKHRQHYQALMKEFPDADKKNINPGRVCFESYDETTFENYNAVAYSKILEVEVDVEKVYISKPTVIEDSVFSKLETWIQKNKMVYASGFKHHYLFMLASACCRFGMDKQETISLLKQNYLSKDSHCSLQVADKVCNSAYGNKFNVFGSAEFSNDRLIDKKTTKEIIIDLADDNIVDVIYGETVYQDALNIFNNGYESAERTGIASIDRIFKWKRGELTVLTGIGNFGKTAWLSFLMVNKSVKDGSKWAVFSPENFPAAEFYHDLAEMIVGANCSPFMTDGTTNYDKPREDIYEKAYRFASEHFFYIYPQEISPTPEYIRSRFLELVIKKKVDGVVIDPFNQLSNDYSSGRDDKYLETFLSECSRFAILNNVYYMIIAHPHKLQKDRDTKAYPVPDVFDLAGGAMWNNKVDNILVYHRPNHHTDPMNNVCELHSRKIRRQKIVGEKGVETFEYSRRKRRFIFDDYPLKRLDLGYVSEPLERKLTPMKDVINYSEPQKDDDWQELYKN